MAHSIDAPDRLGNLQRELLAVPNLVVFEFNLQIKLRFYHVSIQSS